MIQKSLMFGAAAAAAVFMARSPLLAQDAGRSVWQGIYTDAQASRGQSAYGQNCAVCHGATLGGTGEPPPLAGPEFIAIWNGLSVGELFDRIRSTMPLDRPGALSRETYADILSYVLKSNSYPAGASELSTRSEVLATIRMEANRPTGSGAAQPASIVTADPATSAK